MVQFTALAASTGRGTGLNIGWSHVAVVAEILEIAARHDVIIYDPQWDQVIGPDTGP